VPLNFNTLPHRTRSTDNCCFGMGRLLAITVPCLAIQLMHLDAYGLENRSLQYKTCGMSGEALGEKALIYHISWAFSFHPIVKKKSSCPSRAPGAYTGIQHLCNVNGLHTLQAYSRPGTKKFQISSPPQGRGYLET
jgi:hypothetical protein